MLTRIKEDIDCVFKRDPAARNWLEVLTTYPGVHALQMHRLNHWLWHHRCRWFARFLAMIVRWVTGIEIHPGAKIGRRFFIDHGMGVVIGETTEIGNDCTIYHGVTLGGTSWQKGKRHPTLSNDVVIGAGAKVLGPIHLADGARIGSNAVVIHDVPKDATAVGVPGRIITGTGNQTWRRHQIAQKLGFDAYGMTKDMPDPVVNSINRLLDHIHVLDERVENVCAAIQTLGVNVDTDKLPSLEGCQLDNLDKKCIENKN